jgi:23S rRNA (uracil1939-C5)-methyltransferase
MSNNKILQLDLTGVAHQGMAVGRDEGRAVFVPFGVPRERITARITQDKGRYAFAEVVEVLNPSHERVMPRCKHFFICGGCHWQHVDYAAQLRYKQQVVYDQMARIGGFREAIVHPTIASPDPWAYRTHATFHAADDGRLGFVALDGRTTLPIDECHIIRSPLVEMFETLKPERFSPGERVRLQVGSDERERITARIQPTDGTPDPSQQSESGEPERAASGEVVHYRIKGQVFQVTAGGFFQVNLRQAETLVDLALERLELNSGIRALDLYSGVGLFTRFIAENAAHVTAIELYPPAVADAQVNLADMPNVELVEGAIERVLPRVKGKFSAVVIDPPRAGMKPAALEALIQRRPRHIVYVSCEPSTLARDAKRLASAGYTLLDVQPVDMFPQTYHVESVAAFRLS